MAIKRKIEAFTGIIMLLVVCAALFWAVLMPKQHHYDVDRRHFPVKGIDVSAHNGEIDFESVATDTVSFVYIKATEGADFCDSRFARNLAGAKDAGMKAGAYHYFRFGTDGARQAKHFISVTDGYELDLPLAVDVETFGNSPEYQRTEVTKNLRRMIEELRAAGKEPIIYTNRRGYEEILGRNFDDVGLWVCTLKSVPPEEPAWTFWQHSHKGKVAGINGDVDLNTFKGTISDFEATYGQCTCR